MWTFIRGALYALALALGVAIVALNWGTFDPATGTLDLHPFNAYALAAWLASSITAPAVALTAVVKGWGQKS